VLAQFIWRNTLQSVVVVVVEGKKIAILTIPVALVVVQAGIFQAKCI
jgi:hypothetical protein